MKRIVIAAAAIAVAAVLGCGKKHHASGNPACKNPTLSISQVLPASGWNQADTTIAILSSNGAFQSTPQVQVGTTAVQNVAFLNANSISGTVAAGLAAGSYDLVVTNPDGSCGILPGAYTAATQPPPRISNVSPGSIDTQFAGTILITGSNFVAGAAGSLVDSTGTEFALTLSSSMTASSITASAAWGSLSVGPYLVKITNPDAQYDQYSLLVVTQPSGKLSTLVDAGRPLVNPRAYAGAAEGRDDKGSRFLYAVGGSSGTAILDSVEVAQADAFGNLGAWAETSPLVHARSGAGVVRVGEWVYAAAGTGTNGALASVERARILPRTESPQITSIAAGGSGNLAAGTWYYRVSAMKPDGETVASGESTLTLSAASTIHLAWGGVSGATGYRVYRSPDTNGSSGTEVLAAEVTGTSYDDNTASLASTVKPRPAGSLSAWQVDAQSLSARGHVQAAVAWLGTQPYLYVVGGYSAPGIFVGTVEFAQINADGSLGAFTASTNEFNPRADFGISVTTSNNTPGFTGAPQLNVFAGRNVNGTQGGGAVAGETQSAVIGGTGQLGVAALNNNVKNNPAGEDILQANGFIYSIGGGGYSSAPSPSQNVNETNVDSTNVIANWSAASVSLNTSRYGAAAVQQGAFIYILGGVTGSGATANVEQAIY